MHVGAAQVDEEALSSATMATDRWTLIDSSRQSRGSSG